MRFALCTAVALLAAALLPASAQGDVTVEVDQVDADVGLPLILIAGDTGVNRINIEQRANDYVITSVSIPAALPVAGNGCAADAQEPSRIVCPRQKSTNIDLGADDDELTVTALTDPIAAFGGDGDDELNGGAGNDVLAGGNGDDTLDGHQGVDAYFGQAGQDTIEALDGNAERVSCGADTDLVRNDFVDIIAECEGAKDGDADNVSSALDCNDANPSIFPGARETLENGIDEDCDGRDNLILDRDGDGFPVPADCNDANAAIRPGALEVKGNDVDENCDSRAEPFSLLRALVLNNWQVVGRRTKLKLLQVRNAPRGARIVFRCRGKGCPSSRAVTKTVPRDLAPIRLDNRRLRRATLRPGAKLTVQITANATTGRTFTYRVKNGELPPWTVSCRSPNETRNRAC
jgi:hypothetical protein